MNYVSEKFRIWGGLAWACTIVMESIKEKDIFYAECESTATRRVLTDSNYFQVLTEMLEDYKHNRIRHFQEPIR